MDETIGQLKKEELIDLKDAAVVIRKPDGKIKVKQATHLVGAGAAAGGCGLPRRNRGRRRIAVNR